MARHYRNKGRFSSILKLLALLLAAAAAAFVLCWFRPDLFSPGFVRMMEHVREKTEETVRPVVTVTTPAASVDAVVPASPDDLSVNLPESAVSSPITEKPEGSRPVVVPNRPYVPASGDKPLLALIVDDGGNQMDLTRRVAALDLPLTWAIMPYTRFAKETAALAEEKNIPYLLHLPMQAEVDKDGSREYIVGRGMSRDQVRSVTEKALAILPNPIGLNNHRGSLATADWDIMVPVIDVVKAKGLMFVDSCTSGKSVAYKVAYAAGVPTLQNRGFLDGTPDKQAIEARFNEIVRQAVRRGDLITICHFRPMTVQFLEDLNKRKDALPVRLVTIPEIAGLLRAGDDQEDN